MILQGPLFRTVPPCFNYSIAVLPNTMNNSLCKCFVETTHSGYILRYPSVLLIAISASMHSASKLRLAGNQTQTLYINWYYYKKQTHSCQAMPHFVKS